MRYQVQLNEDADADWRALAPRARRIVKARLRDLANNPLGRWSLSLCGDTDAFRAVADGYRILFIITRAPGGQRLVLVFRIHPRATAYVGYEFAKT